MNIEILNNIVEKLIKPKYPWIKNFDWGGPFGKKEKLYVLYIDVNSNFDYTMLGKYTVELEDEIKSIFRMLGTEPDEKFWYVNIL